MGKKYEDEIREILKGFDDPEDRPRRPKDPSSTPPRPSSPSRTPMPALSMPRWNFNPQRIMGFALILFLIAWVMQGPWAAGFRELYPIAGLISLVGTGLFIVALIAMLRAGGRFGGSVGAGQREQRWRGQVIYLPNRQPFWVRWRHSLSRLFRPRR